MTIAKDLNPYNFSTSDYFVDIGVSLFLAPGKQLWQVFNLSRGIVEFEAHQLPAAISAAYELQRGLNLIREGKLEESPAMLQFVPPAAADTVN
jgi:hypothetical protein